MKTEYRIIALSIIFGLVYWVIDAILDYSSHGGSFWVLLISDVPAREAHTRVLILESFLLFGIVLSMIHRQAKKALRRARDEYARLIESAAYGIFTADMEGKFTLVNQEFADIFGYTKEQIIEGDLSVLTGTKILKNLIDTIAGAKKTMHLGLPCYTKDGKEIFVDAHFNPIRKGDEVVGIQGILQDMTEQNLTEMELRKCEMEYKNL